MKPFIRHGSGGTALAVMLLLAACGPSASSGAGASGAPRATAPAFEPGPIDRARTICIANAPRLAGLVNKIRSPTTAETLTFRGSAVAQLTGVLSAELQEFRNLDLENARTIGTEAPAWFAELEALVTAGSAAVDASARHSLGDFKTAKDQVITHLRQSSELSRRVGLTACAVDLPK